MEGYAGYKCKQKLKILKEFLKGWNKEVFRDMESKFQDAAKKVEQMDMRNESHKMEDFELDLRRASFDEMWDIMSKREAIWKQKSRVIGFSWEIITRDTFIELKMGERLRIIFQGYGVRTSGWRNHM
ncbi:hypothetical protein SLA2020_132300 [Shorea laevis]